MHHGMTSKTLELEETSSSPQYSNYPPSWNVLHLNWILIRYSGADLNMTLHRCTQTSPWRLRVKRTFSSGNSKQKKKNIANYCCWESPLTASTASRWIIHLNIKSQRNAHNSVSTHVRSPTCKHLNYSVPALIDRLLNLTALSLMIHSSLL